MKTTTTLSAALFAVSTLATTSTASADEVTLRAVSAFTLGTAFSREFESFVEWINENGKGVVQINMVGGP
ncbi:MAG TPA: ABC transporter substrate-binding protein, partial [Sulfitobacter sp.]|nr:ABC transporter substrate-binding protein [Sulfitobacter sp.]